jgi:hypothetical protein
LSHALLDAWRTSKVRAGEPTREALRRGESCGASPRGQGRSPANRGTGRGLGRPAAEVTRIVTKFLGRWGRGTGSWYVVRYLRETFTLRVKNEPVNPGRESKVVNPFYVTMVTRGASEVGRWFPNGVTLLRTSTEKEDDGEATGKQRWRLGSFFSLRLTSRSHGDGVLHRVRA